MGLYWQATVVGAQHKGQPFCGEEKNQIWKTITLHFSCLARNLIVCCFFRLIFCQCHQVARCIIYSMSQIQYVAYKNRYEKYIQAYYTWTIMHEEEDQPRLPNHIIVRGDLINYWLCFISKQLISMNARQRFWLL